jgi:hypothetical protein
MPSHAGNGVRPGRQCRGTGGDQLPRPELRLDSSRRIGGSQEGDQWSGCQRDGEPWREPMGLTERFTSDPFLPAKRKA